MTKDILYLKRDGAIATIVINNPEKRNALNLEAWRLLGEISAELEADDDVRCVLVTGEGDHFAAGADISEFPAIRNNAAQAIAYGDIVAVSLERFMNLKHPTVAVIRGACTGGGLEIACCCDLRIAAEGSRYGVPINRLGHAFAYPEMAAALCAVPATVVLELLLEGRILEAEEALAKGLITRLVPAADLDKEVEATVKRIATGAPLANRMSKKILRRLQKPEPITRAELEAAYAPCDSEDYREGVRAFMAKEKAVFKGR